MPLGADRLAIAAIRDAAHRLQGTPADFDPLLSVVGDARLVLLGEASHGTHDFYRVRAEITKRLIREKGFSAVAVEADWPDAYRVNRYVRGRSRDADASGGLERLRAIPPVDVAQRRRPRFRRMASRAQRRPGRRGRQDRASTGSTCTACTPQCRP